MRAVQPDKLSILMGLMGSCQRQMDSPQSSDPSQETKSQRYPTQTGSLSNDEAQKKEAVASLKPSQQSVTNCFLLHIKYNKRSVTLCAVIEPWMHKNAYLYDDL